MNIKVLFLEVCRFDPSQTDVNHITLIGMVEGIPQPVTMKITNQTKAATTAIVNAAGLGTPKDTKRVGAGKVGKNKGIAWRVFATGTKPERSSATTATEEVDFE
jgi:hypothetical protein